MRSLRDGQHFFLLPDGPTGLSISFRSIACKFFEDPINSFLGLIATSTFIRSVSSLRYYESEERILLSTAAVLSVTITESG